MNENIINVNVPNAITIVIMGAIGMALLNFVHKLAARHQADTASPPGYDAPGR